MQIKKINYEKWEEKARKSCSKNGIDLTGALHVFLVKGGWGAVYSDRIAKYPVTQKFRAQHSEEIPIRNVTSVEVSGGLVSSTIKIYSAGNSFDLESASCDIPIVVSTIRRLMTQIQIVGIANVGDSSNENNLVEQLEKLASLLASGSLTAGEYSQAKQKLLES